jgi:hypothetical protein
MSDREDLERDIAEEDQLFALLRHGGPRVAIPPFAEVVRRAETRRSVGPSLALAAAALLVVVAVAAIGALRPSSTPGTAIASGSPAPPSSAVTSGCGEIPAGALVHAPQAGKWLRMSLDAVQPTDAQTNQLRWLIRFAVPAGAPGPATLTISGTTSPGENAVKIRAGDRLFQQVLGYELVEPQQRSIAAGEVLTIQPCSTLVMVARMAGPLIDGTFPYSVTVENIGLPEGGTITATLDVRLSCTNRTRTCGPVDAQSTAAPTSTPVAGVLKTDFGLIYDGVRQGWEKGSAPLVRREGETSFAVGELAPSFFNQFNGAISPDGRRAVYFAQRQGEPWALYLLDGAHPNDQRKLLALPIGVPDGEIPGGPLVWSADGDGIAFVVLDAGANQGVTPKYSAIHTLDFSTGKVAELARVEGGSRYAIVGWDRARSTLAALLSPDRGPTSTYLVLSGAAQRTWPLDAVYAMAPSPDARDVAALRCDKDTGPCTSLWTWPLDDFGARTDQHIGSGLSLGLIGWRPGTDELGLLVGTPNAAFDRIEVWSATGGTQVVYRGASERTFFRADGSAIFSAGNGEAIVIDLSTGTVSPVPFPAPQQPYEIGRLRASIRLGG